MKSYTADERRSTSHEILVTVLGLVAVFAPVILGLTALSGVWGPLAKP